MRTTAQDVFTALYEAFHKLDTIKAPEPPEVNAAPAALEVYKERLDAADKEVQNVLDEGSKLLERFVDSRIKKMIAKMIYDGELKGRQ